MRSKLIKKLMDEYNKARGPVIEARMTMLNKYDGEQYVVLDAGAGRRAQDREARGRVISFDIVKKPGLDAIADIHHIPFRDDTFDCALCTQVFEHIGNPHQASRELYRVLKPGGEVLITAPFVWKEHNNPVDYWRFTRSGFYYLLSTAGFTDIKIKSAGGYFIVLNHILNKLGTRLMGKYLGAVYNVAYKPIGYLLYLLDKVLPHEDFPIGHVVYGRKGAS